MVGSGLEGAVDLGDYPGPAAAGAGPLRKLFHRAAVSVAGLARLSGIP